jgi:peroxiredoxin Q/BCP
MSELHIDDFELPSTGGTPFRLSAFRGKNVVMYFYPKDDTPGCTVEGQEFGALHDDFVKAETVVVGVSRDDLKSHDKFKAKFDFPFQLLADTDEKICEQFGVMKFKNLYGKQVRGVDRSTFVFDRNGQLVKAWRSLKAPGHAAEVLSFVQSLK